MASAAGGMEIEEVAEKIPPPFCANRFIPSVGLQPYQARKLAFGLGLSGEAANRAAPFFQALYRAFRRHRRFHAGNQSLRLDRRRPSRRARRQDDLRRQRPLPPQRTARTARSRRRRSARSGSLQSTVSTTSSSTATSPAWSMAQAWPWPLWTSSNTPAARPRTSSTSAEALPRSR